MQDIERQEPNDYRALLAECEERAKTGGKDRLPAGPIADRPARPERIVQRSRRPALVRDARSLTAKNLEALAKIGKEHNVRFYLEALTFTPLNRLDQQLELLEETARDNVGLVLDFFHLWNSGTRPEEIARVNKDLIFCVDFCDSLDAFGTHGRPSTSAGGTSGPEAAASRSRNGSTPSRRPASTASGGANCSAPKYWELDPWQTARDLKTFLEYLLV